jgi:hypothetical protein
MSQLLTVVDFAQLKYFLTFSLVFSVFLHLRTYLKSYGPSQRVCVFTPSIYCGFYALNPKNQQVRPRDAAGARAPASETASQLVSNRLMVCCCFSSCCCYYYFCFCKSHHQNNCDRKLCCLFTLLLLLLHLLLTLLLLLLLLLPPPPPLSSALLVTPTWARAPHSTRSLEPKE